MDRHLGSRKFLSPLFKVPRMARSARLMQGSGQAAGRSAAFTGPSLVESLDTIRRERLRTPLKGAVGGGSLLLRELRPRERCHPCA